MLSELSLQLAGDAVVTVVGRSRSRLAGLEQRSGGRITGISVDYRHSAEFAAALQMATLLRGPLTLAVAWLHDDAPDGLATITDRIVADGVPAHLFHIRASSATAPFWPFILRQEFGPEGLVTYHEVTLGFRMEGGSSRWLRHGEIVAGVAEAIRTNRERSIVGVVRPWGMHP